MWAWFIPSFFFSFFLSFRHYKSRLSWIDSRRPNIGRKQNFKSIPALKVENCLLSTHPYQLIQNPIPTWTTIRFRGFETGSKMIKAISFQTDFENRTMGIEKGKTIKAIQLKSADLTLVYVVWCLHMSTNELRFHLNLGSWCLASRNLCVFEI